MKNKNSKIYILPGWGSRYTDKDYKYLMKEAKKKSYDFVDLKIATRNKKYCLGNDKSVREIINKIKKQILNKHKEKENVLIGFSIGALQAYLLATELEFKKVILCSISTMLKRDIESVDKKEFTNIITEEQYTELSKIDYERIKSGEVFFMVGDKEGDYMKSRIREIAKLNNAKIVEIKDQDHYFNKKYVDEVLKII